MEALIRSAESLQNLFEQRGNLHKGYFVSAEIRKEILLSCSQGKIVNDGQHLRFNFDDIGGGVFYATAVDGRHFR